MNWALPNGEAGRAPVPGDRGATVVEPRKTLHEVRSVAESFFATIKKELVHRRTWPTRRELTSEVFEYVEAFYNPTRRHSTLG